MEIGRFLIGGFYPGLLSREHILDRGHLAPVPDDPDHANSPFDNDQSKQTNGGGHNW